jgi:hypothetical protein
MLERYEQLHAELIQLLCEYHNYYIKFIKGKQTFNDAIKMKRVLRKIKTQSGMLYKEVVNVRKSKEEKYKDAYQAQRNRYKKETENGNNS